MDEDRDAEIDEDDNYRITPSLLLPSLLHSLTHSLPPRTGLPPASE